MDERDREWLKDMLEHAGKAVLILGSLDAEALAADETKLLAVSLAIQVVGEAANHVSQKTQAALPEIPWTDIIGMRHRLVHGYRTRSPQVIAETVREHLPPLITALERAVEDEGK
jgi:uncharacterized protein with HEPN domain